MKTSLAYLGEEACTKLIFFNYSVSMVSLKYYENLWFLQFSYILINSQGFSRCPLANRLLRTSTTAAPLLSRLLPPAGTVNICEYKAAKHKRRGESNAFLAFLHLFFLSKLCFHVFPQLIQPTSFNFIRYWMILDLGLP